MGRNQSSYGPATPDFTVEGEFTQTLLGGKYYNFRATIYFDYESIELSKEHKDTNIAIPSFELLGIGPDPSAIADETITDAAFFKIRSSTGAQGAVYDVYVTAQMNQALSTSPRIYCQVSVRVSTHPHIVYARMLLTVRTNSDCFNWSGMCGLITNTLEVINKDQPVGGVNTHIGGISNINDTAYNDVSYTGDFGNYTIKKFVTNCTDCEADLTVAGLLAAMAKPEVVVPEWFDKNATLEEQFASLEFRQGDYQVYAKITDVKNASLSLNSINKGQLVCGVYSYSSTGLSLGSTLLGVTGTQIHQKGSFINHKARFATGVAVFEYLMSGGTTIDEATAAMTNSCNGDIEVTTYMVESGTEYEIQKQTIRVRMVGVALLANFDITNSGGLVLSDTYDGGEIWNPSACPSEIKVDVNAKLVSKINNAARTLNFTVFSTEDNYNNGSTAFDLCSLGITIGNVTTGVATGPNGKQWGGGAGSPIQWTNAHWMCSGFEIGLVGGESNPSANVWYNTSTISVNISYTIAIESNYYNTPPNPDPGPNFPCWS